jgi:hypothetical protein
MPYETNHVQAERPLWLDGAVPYVFLSYRRDDAPESVGWLHSTLESRFGPDAVVRDVQIPVGMDWVEAITRASGNCRALLAIVGPKWETLTAPDGSPRLGGAEDWVSREIETALACAEIKVIPVLINDTTMPRADALPESLRGLARLNACRLRTTDWEADSANLIRVLAPLLERSAQPQPHPRSTRRPSWLAAGAVAILASIAGLMAAVLTSGLDARVAADYDRSDTAEVVRRTAAYALDRGLTWAVLGAAMLIGWVTLTGAGRSVLSSGLAGAVAGAIGGAVGGTVFLLTRNLHATVPEVPVGMPVRMLAYALVAGMIGGRLARATRLTRGEAVAIGSVAGAVAAVVTAKSPDVPRALQLGVENLIVAAALVAVAVCVSRSRDVGTS